MTGEYEIIMYAPLSNFIQSDHLFFFFEGVYGSMVKSNRPDFDYIMLIDTEGLLSVEKNDEEYDRRLILFCLAVSHLVIVNVVGEVNATLMKMLILCTDSLQKLGVSKVHRPHVHIVLNQKANPDLESNGTTIETTIATTSGATIGKIIDELKKANLDKELEINEETCHTLPSAFKKEHFPGDQVTAKLFRTDPDFIKKVQRLCEQFVSTAAKSLEQAREQFSDPLRWVKFAATVLEILRKFPDMTYFNDIREREQDDLMREWIRKILEQTFTARLRQDLLNEVVGQSVRETKTVFEFKFQTFREDLTNELKKQLKFTAAMETVRKRSETFLNAQINSLLYAWIESAIMNNERRQLEELVHKGETQFHDIIQQTIEAIRKNEHHHLEKLVPNVHTQFLNDIQATIRDTSRLSEEQAGNIFDKIWNNTYPRVASEFKHDNQLRSALQFVYRNYHIFEKSNLPDIKALLPLLDVIPRSTEATPATPRSNADRTAQEQNDMQIFGRIQKKCIQNMFSHTPIEELPFKYDTTAEYTRMTICNFTHLYVPTIIMEYDRYHKDGRTGIWSPEFHLHLRRFILKKDSAPAPSDEQPGIWKKLLHIGKSFTKLLDIIFSLVVLDETVPRFRPVDIDLVQQLVGMVLGHIREINNELDIFKLAASKHYLGMVHTYTVLVLTKFYYDEQWRFFDKVLVKVREKQPGWRAYFIAMVTQDQKADPRFAEDLVKVFVDSVIEYFQTKVKEKIRAQTELDGTTLDRSTLLDDLDTSISSMTNDELYDYMKDPLAALSRKFNERWMKIKAAIELFIVECKQKCKLIIDQFFQLLQIIQSVLQQFQAEKITFISQLFTTRDGSDALNTVNKGRCASFFLYAYFCQTNPFPSQFQLFNVTYLLSGTGMQMIKQFQPPPPDVKAIFLTMADKFNSTSILNLAVFVQKCLDQKLTAHESFENKSKNSIIMLNELCVKEEQIFQIKQCKGERSTCPCCNRICDVDHSIDKTSAPGTGNNLHHCQIGHQYRAFARVKHVNKNNVTGLHEPSMQRCEHLQDRDRVTIVNVNGGIDTVRWADYVLKNKDWNWDFRLQQISTSSHNLSTNLPTIWSRIGKQWCKTHDMDFVTMNRKATRDSNYYNAVAGQSVIANVLSYDKHGNPMETMYDLGRDGAFSDYSILIGQFYADGQFNDLAMQKSIDALKLKGFAVKHVKTENEFITELQSKCHKIAWVISTSSIQNGALVTALTTFHSAGGAIFLFADNAPFLCHASEFLQRKFGITLSADYYLGCKMLTYKENGHLQTGHFGQHDIFTGIQNLYEGHTICHPVYPTQESRKALVTLATATDGNPSIAVYNPSATSSEGRLALDCGFTKLYVNWDTAGTARYIVNISCWLLGLE